MRAEARAFYIAVAPWLIGLTVFTLGPILISFGLAFTNWNSFQTPSFVGLDNYIRLFTKDPLFWKSLLNTVEFTVLSVPTALFIALGLAHLLARPRWGRRLFRTVIYLPAVVPLVSAAMIFRWLLGPSDGPVNSLLGFFGIPGPAWLSDPPWVIPAVVLLSLWQVGNGTILLIAGINSIPAETLEAARVDGASPVAQFWRITVPLVSPILFFNLITGMIGAFQVFSQVYVLTEGKSGPDNAALMMVPYLFKAAFQNYQMGYASALAWVLFAVIMTLSLLAMRLSSRWVYYESGPIR